MIRIPNGWYCAALPTGEFVALVKDSHLETDRGRVDLPYGQNLLFLRLSPNGVSFAGIGHRDDHCWEWDGVRWSDRGIAFGPRAVAYDAFGALHILIGPPAHGWRNYPTTAEATYADTTRQVWEFTDLPGVTIGQGGEGPHGDDPAIALINGTRRLIEAGRCRSIVVADGPRIAIAYSREDTREAVIRWLSRDGLAQLPLVQTAPAPTPIPIPVPQPIPEPVPMALPDPYAVRAALKRERDKFPAERIGNTEMGAILNNAAAQFPHVGMHFRTGEKAATAPGVSRTFSRDVLRYLPPGDDFGWWSDVLGATGAGLATPAAPDWKRSTDDRASFVPPVSSVPVPDPGTPPPIPGTDLEARVARIEAWIRRAL